MFGIRVFDLPANTTDKHLKVYFSNPRNGGGRVVNIYHPLPHGTAVVVFDDKRVVQDVLKREHVLLGQPIGISATPKQVFRRAVVELEKYVSDFLSVNPQLVDELQFIGEININFQYEKERYLLDGSWYKIEWAMQYLDTALDAYQPDMQPDIAPLSPRSNTNGLPRERVSRRQFEARVESPPRSSQIKRPNIPAIKQSKEDEQPKSLPIMTDPPLSNFRKITGDQTNENDSVQRQKKNKNVFPTGGTTSKSFTADNKLYSQTMRSNLDDKSYEDNYYESKNRGAVGNNFGADEYWNTRGPSYNTFDKGDDSDSENEANLAAAYDRRVGFSSDTNFAENKARPQKAVPMMTRGIDVSHTDFGEVPLSFTFDLPGNLKVHVAMDDITKQTTDTIINPTTSELSNVYGISRAIVASAGYEMQMECQRYVEENGPLNYAGVTHTAAGGNLSQRIWFVIHTAGPSWREDESEYCTHMLVCTYINCFQYADKKLWIQSLATPLISAGSFGFPLDVCIGAFYDALLIFSDQSTTKRHLKEIHLVCFDQDSAMATIIIVQSLLDCERSQSVAAATDRYWMRKSKYNFQAEDYSKPVTPEIVKDKSDVEDSDTNDAGTSAPREKTKAVNREFKKDLEKSDDLGDSDDESRELAFASGKSDLDTGEFKPSTHFKRSSAERVSQKEDHTLHDESDNSFKDSRKEKDDDYFIDIRKKKSEEKSGNTEFTVSSIESSDVGNKYKDVDSDNESNTRAKTVDSLMEEKVHDYKENFDTEKGYKLRDTTIGTDDEVNEEEEEDDDDEKKKFGEKEPNERDTVATRTDSAEDLKNSMTKSDEDDNEAEKDVNKEDNVSCDDGDAVEENEEDLFL